MMKPGDIKIAYLHGRSGPHVMHGRLAKSVGGEFYHVDTKMRWHDLKTTRLYKIFGWIVNGIFFPKIRKYHLFLISGPHVSPIVMKTLRLSRKQRVVAHLGDETLYFMYSGWYSKLSKRFMLAILSRYDALLCEGAMSSHLANRLLKGKKPKIYTTYLGVPKERLNKLNSITPNLNGTNIIFIAAGPSGWRSWYKGLDLMISAFSIAKKSNQLLRFTIVGEWNQQEVKSQLSGYDKSITRDISFVGRTNEIEKYLAESTLYLHCSRGDAFPTVTLEAMISGLVPIVSEWTGTKEVVQEIENGFVVPLEPEIIAEKIVWYFNLPSNLKQRYSLMAREVAKKFTEERAVIHYQKVFQKLYKDLKMTL